MYFIKQSFELSGVNSVVSSHSPRLPIPVLDLPQTPIVYELSVMPRRLTREDASDSMKSNWFDPIEPYRNSDTPWLSIRSSCGDQVSPTLSNAKIGKGGCAICSKGFVDPEDAKNDMRAAGDELLETIPGALKKRRCLCMSFGREIFPLRATVQQGQGACGHCCQNALFDIAQTIQLNLLDSQIPARPT